MKIIGVLPMALLISAAPVPMPAEPEPHTLARKIFCPIDANRYVVGSGTYIGPNSILTAAHVAAGRKCYVDGEPVRTVYVNGKQDIAVLHIARSVPRWLPLDCGRPRKGRIVSVYGYPRGERLEKRVFEATGKFVPNDDPDWGGMALFSGAATSGQSGSAIIYNGRIIGVLNAGNAYEMLGTILRGTYLCGRRG
jgi:V8-like Glu-specific endopeptidase